MVMPWASALRASPNTHWSASPKAAIGPVSGLTIPILTVRPAARTGPVKSVGAASMVAAPAPKASMTWRRDGCFGLLAIARPSLDFHRFRRLLNEFYRHGRGAGNWAEGARVKDPVVMPGLVPGIHGY